MSKKFEPTSIVFMDTETTSLRHDRDVWELGAIRRLPGAADKEYHAFAAVNLAEADPFSLEIGGFYRRHPHGRLLSGVRDNDAPVLVQDQLYEQVAPLLHGALIVGAVPWFDTQALERRARKAFGRYGFHYHLVDIEALAAGALGMRPPWDFDTILGAFGLSYDEEDRHTALGDARMVRDLYDAVYARADRSDDQA